MTFANKLRAWWAHTWSLLRHRVSQQPRTHHYARWVAFALAIFVVSWAIHHDAWTDQNVSPVQGAHLLDPLRRSIAKNLEYRDWIDAHGNPLPCSQVQVPKNAKTAAAIQAELPLGWKVWDGREIPVGQSIALPSAPGQPKVRLMAIAASGHSKRGECPYGCDLFAGRPLDGKPEEIAVYPMNPWAAFDNLWIAEAAAVKSSKLGLGAKVGVRWEIGSFRLGKHTSYRLFPFIGAEGRLFSGYYDLETEAGATIHRR